jgi:hypothetical protein
MSATFSNLRHPYADPRQIGPNTWASESPNWKESCPIDTNGSVELLVERLRTHVPENAEEAESKARLLTSDFFRRKSLRSDDV